MEIELSKCTYLVFLVCAYRITFVFPQKKGKSGKKIQKKKKRDEVDSRPINAIFVVLGFQDPKTVREGDRERRNGRIFIIFRSPKGANHA